jgi:hypothetical protein
MAYAIDGRAGLLGVKEGAGLWQEVKAWTQHLEAQSWVAQGGPERWDSATAWEEEEMADRRGPHGSDMRERRCHYRIAQTRREGIF